VQNLLEECGQGVNLPSLYLEPVGGKKNIQVCDAWPVRRHTYTATFWDEGHHRPLTGTKLYCKVT